MSAGYYYSLHTRQHEGHINHLDGIGGRRIAFMPSHSPGPHIAHFWSTLDLTALGDSPHSIAAQLHVPYTWKDFPDWSDCPAGLVGRMSPAKSTFHHSA